MEKITKWRVYGLRVCGSSYLVPFSKIKANNRDRSINKYKETQQVKVAYDSIKTILSNIKQLDAERVETLNQLKELLK